MELLQILQNRKSIRKYTDEAIPEESLKKVLQAGLLSASSRSICPWEFIVVRDKETLVKMADCRIGAAEMLKNAACAVVVVGNEAKSDVWIEDCSIAMANMHLMADALGLGSCWIQGRLRQTKDGISTEEFLRNILHFGEEYRLEAILSLGMIENHPKGYQLDELKQEKIHWNQF